MLIYCSGGVRKSSDAADKLCWGDAERDAVRHALHPLPVQFVDPEAPVEDLSDSAALFGRDIYGIRAANAVIVDARQRRGIGIGIEMAVAKLYEKPLVAVVPPESHYQQSDIWLRGGVIEQYTHPHLLGLCDAIVGDFAAAGGWLKDHRRRRAPVKGTEALDQAIEAYERALRPTDDGMPIPMGAVQ